MHLILARHSHDADSTLGQLFIEGAGTAPICWTVEDEPRKFKVQGETRIPAGTYEVTLRSVGGFHQRTLQRFGPDFHKGMLWLRNVPGFEYILIHTGNSDDDSEGCIIVGSNAVKNGRGGGRVTESVKAYQALYPVVRDALIRGERVTIEVRDD